MKQKVTRFVLTLLVMMLTMTQTAWALTTITPTTPSQDDDGYYLIGTAAELYGFAELVNNGNKTANAKLTADIVVNENVLNADGEANAGPFVQWTPIGNVFYSGTFDGQGHTISGLYVSGNSGKVGLIGTVSGSATIKNLGIVDSYFNSSGNFLGSIVGNVDRQSSVTLANVYSTSTVKGVNFIGGLVGGSGYRSVTIINSYFAGKTSAGWSYGDHHDDLVSGDFIGSDSGTPNIVNTFVVGTSLYGTAVTAEQLSDGTVAAALHYYQDALADGSMFGLSGGKTNFSGTIDGVSVPTANITLHTFTGDTKTYSSKYVVGNTTPLPVNVACEGYNKFAGWYNNANLVGDAVTSISSSETGDKEYWAKYKQSHTVTFELDGGMIEKGNIDHYIEGEVTPLPAVVRKGGASFEGWYTTADFSGDRYVAIPATATEDITFYAKWGEAKTSFYLMQPMQGPEPVSILYEGENIVWLDETTERYMIFNNEFKFWGSDNTITVPYVGGEYAFSDNSGSNFRVHQSGFYVFTLTARGDENWFVSVLKLKSMLNCDVASIPTQVYTGSAIEPAVTVKDGETTLNPDEVYEVTYSNNVNAGTATVTITGKGDYSGETAATFTIIPKAVTNDGITIAAIADQTYTGSAIEPAVTVKDGETTLALGTDYTIGYSANVNVGTATATITGKGNYSGSREATFTIIPKAVTNEDITVTIPSQTWTGNELTPVITVNDGETVLTLDEDYTVNAPSGPIQDSGNYTYTITGMGNYSGEKAATFTISPKAVTNDGITVTIPSQTWTGNELTPVITVKDGENVLTENTDYTVTPPSGPIQDSGNHAYTITGMGNYAGSRVAMFTISPRLARQAGAVYVYEDQNGMTALLDGTSVDPVDIDFDHNIIVNHVTSNRVFTPGMASTVMLPFNYTCNGNEGGTFYKFVGVKKENDKWVATMQETGNDTNKQGTLEANTPYLFMPAATEMTFPNINGSVTLSTEGGGNCVTADPGSHWTFKGTYWFKEWNSNDYYYTAEEIGRAYGFAGVAKDGINVGDFVRVASGAKIRPMRAYLLWNNEPNSANARSFTRGAAATDEELPQSITVRLVGSNGETTGIGTLDTKTGEVRGMVHARRCAPEWQAHQEGTVY